MKYWIIILATFFIISCKKEQIEQTEKTEKTETDLGIPIPKSVSKLIVKRDFPLQEVSKVELISYCNRVIWDTISFNGQNPIQKSLVDNYKLTFDSTMIKERITLNKVQQKDLLNLIVCDTCVPEEVDMACYDPRHMILFRDKRNKIIGYNEFCFTCLGSRSSENLNDFQKYCYSDMNDLFKKFGIKYFIEDPNDENKEYLFLKSKGYIKD